MNSLTNHERRTTNHESGYLSILIAVLLVIVTVLAISLTALYMSSMRGAVDRLESAKAFGIAEAGLERGHFGLSSPFVQAGMPALSQRYSCAGTNFANQAFGAGEFTVFSVGGAATDVITSLTTSVTDSATIIPVTSITGLAAQGRVVVTGEAIDYSGTSSSAATCGTAPCLFGALRGVAGTQAAAHASGEAVSQYQCTLQSQGGVPNLTSPRVKRVVQQGGYQLQKAWIVGNTVAGNDVISKWDGMTWVREGPFAAVPDVTYNGVFMHSYADGWAVGGSGNIIRYNGTSWSLFQDTGNQTFNDVFCNSSTDCWAAVTSAAFFRYDGTTWNSFSGPGGNFQMNAVWCTASTNCWGVANSGRFYRFNGSAWSLFQTVGTSNVNDVTCLASNDCWAIGDSYKIYYFNGTIWSDPPSYDLGNTQMQGIYCVSSTDCWAVGPASTYARWDGVSWSNYVTGLPNNNFTSVSCYKTYDCWAVGQNGTITHWDGAVWSPVVQSLPTADFTEIYTVGAKGRALSAWKADFH